MRHLLLFIAVFLALALYACATVFAGIKLALLQPAYLLVCAIFPLCWLACYITPKITGEKREKIFRWQPSTRTVRRPEILGSIRTIWNGKYHPEERREDLHLKGPLTFLERLVMIILLLRTYIDLGYGLRKFFVTEEGETQFIEVYVSAIVLALITVLFSPLADSEAMIIGLLVGWETIGALFQPLRIVFVDRYAAHEPDPYNGLRSKWGPYSFNRSLIFLFVNYWQIVIGFAYLYLHFGRVCHSDCTNPITSAWDALYFSVVTITTLGYGDMRPTSWFGRLLASIEPIMGILLLIVVVGLFFVELGRLHTERRE